MDPKSLPLPLQNLKSRLQQAREVAVLAVGSDLNGDDGVAIRVAELLEPYTGEGKSLHTFIGGTAPENCTGPIRRLNPSHLVVIDAADMGQAPGTVESIDPRQLTGITFCTHALPLNVIIDYILKSCPECEVIVLGVQPQRLDFAEPLTPAVERAAHALAMALSGRASDSQSAREPT
jgi:hydrogenase 3 maturation protease